MQETVFNHKEHKGPASDGGAPKHDRSCLFEIASVLRRIFVVNAYHDKNQHFIVRGDESLTAFLELERDVAQNWQGYMDQLKSRRQPCRKSRGADHIAA